MSVSCSTTINVFPKSLISFNEFINFSLSLWWSPILGSSNTYNTPVKWDPIWVASLIRCASPPDKVPALLDRVKYSNPTFCKNDSLSPISFNIKFAIWACSSPNFKLLKNLINSFIDIEVTS